MYILFLSHISPLLEIGSGAEDAIHLAPNNDGSRALAHGGSLLRSLEALQFISGLVVPLQDLVAELLE